MSSSPLRQQTIHLLRTNKVKQAHTVLVSELRNNPENHEAWYLMANINAHIGDFSKACKIIDKALTLTSNAEYLIAKAKYLCLDGQSAACSTVLSTLSISALNNPTDLDTLANIYTRLGEYEQAHACYIKALANAKTPGDILVNAAISYTIMAQPERSLTLLQQAIASSEHNPRAHFLFAEHAPIKLADEHHQQVTLLAQQETDAHSKQYLHHAAALQLEKQAKFHAAFDAFAASKECVAASVHFDATKHRNFCQQIMTLPALAPSDSHASPVFIAGMPRTGTTLLDKLLCQSPHLASLGELNEIAQGVKHQSGESTPAVLSTQIIGSAAQQSTQDLAKRYQHRYNTLKGGVQHGCDKQPFNFYYLDFIVSAFPTAKIILMVRDKADTCIANFRQLYQTQSPFHHYAFKLEHISAFYDDYRALANHFAQKYPNNVTLQHYEQLVTEGEATMRNLFEFCQLPYPEDCLDFYKHPSACATASKLQIRQPLNTRSIGYWRNYAQKYQP